MKKFFMLSTTLFTVFAANHVFAAPAVQLKSGEQGADVTVDADGQPFSVFSKNNQLFFLFAHRQPVALDVPKNVRDSYNVTAQKVLDVTSGVGVSVVFENAPKYNISVKNTPSTANVPVSVLNLKDGLRISGTPQQVLKFNENGVDYTVVPAVQLKNRTVENFGKITQNESDAGLVLTAEDTKLVSAYSNGELSVASSRKDLAAFIKNVTNPNTPKPAPEPKIEEKPAEEKLAAVPSPVVIEKGASKIILKQPIDAVDTVENKVKVSEPAKLTDKQVEAVQPKTIAQTDSPLEDVNADADNVQNPLTEQAITAAQDVTETPAFAKMFDTQADVELLQEQKLAEIQPIDAVKSTEQPKVQALQNVEEKTRAFENAMKELEQARAQLEERYVPRVVESVTDDVPQIKKLANVEADDGFSDEFFGNDTARAEDYVEEEILETDLEQEVNLTNLSDSELYMLAEEVLGDHINEEAFREKQRALGVTIERDTFLNTVDLIDVAEDDALFKMYGDGTAEAYQQFYKRFLEALANVKDKNKKDLYRLALSKLNLAYNRPFEALMVLDNMPKNQETGLPKNNAARLMMATANLVINRPEDAAYYLKSNVPAFEADYEIWNSVYNESQDADDMKTADAFEKNAEHMATYPLHLMTEVYLSYARVLLRLERLSELKDLMQELAGKDRRGQLPAEGTLLLARAYILERNDELAEALLAQAAASDNPNVAFMAQYEFVDFLLNKGDLGVNQAISHLENLRYLWRGGKVESDILTKLGRMYIYKGKQREGLKRLKQHNIYFSNSEKPVKLATDVMTKAFSSLYFDENVKTEHDLVELLGIYYDYRELTPAGEEGDRLISLISERLRNLQLFDRATELMENQLKYRAKTGLEKARVGTLLADLYYLNRQNNEALNALNRTETAEIPKRLQEERDLIQAKAYMNMRKYEDALRILKTLKTSQAEDLIARISWIEEVYPKVISYLEPIYDRPQLLPDEWGSEEKVSLTELAVAYNMTGRLRDLESLKNRYKKQIEADENMKNVFEFLLMEQGSNTVVVPQQQNDLWTKLTDSMKDYYTFVDFYKEFREERLESREDKELFNRRMRQISAPARL